MGDSQDPRRHIPRTDVLMAGADLAHAAEHLGREAVRSAVRAAQERARRGELSPQDVGAAALADLTAAEPSQMGPVLNATGVVLHTNLGRAPLSEAAQRAMVAAGGYVDVEYDARLGARAGRGRHALAAVAQAVPAAESALVVTNGAAALLLAVTALAGRREVLISRGELVEIGDGFRLPDLITSAGTRIREVGATNRARAQDYAQAITRRTAAIVKVHPSNFQITGFTSEASLEDLAGLGLPVIADLGSGLLRPDPGLPDEPDATTALLAGADIVTFSCDKLLGGPQAGLALGRRELVDRMRRHPLARAVRVDKTTLAALAATLRGPTPPATSYRRLTATALSVRAHALAQRVGAPVVACEGAVGGGSAPGVRLPGWAVALPEGCAAPLRLADPPVIARVEGGRCLVDPRCVPAEQDSLLAEAMAAAMAAVGH
jgi:L-seryl-tRNA(Ser) seleniumtransferase